MFELRETLKGVWEEAEFRSQMLTKRSGFADPLSKSTPLFVRLRFDSTFRYQTYITVFYNSTI